MIMHDEDYDEKKMLGDIRRMDKTKESSAAVEAGKLKSMCQGLLLPT
jgi:hypothetical protein